MKPEPPNTVAIVRVAIACLPWLCCGALIGARGGMLKVGFDLGRRRTYHPSGRWGVAKW